MVLSREQEISARFHDNARQIRFVSQARKEILIIASVQLLNLTLYVFWASKEETHSFYIIIMIL